MLLSLRSEVVSQESQAASELAGKQAERIAADKFLEILLKRPATGTSLNRLFEFHVEQGDLGDLIQRLRDAAETSTDEDATGRHWMLIGLLQLKRGEDGQAAEALARASDLLKSNAMVAAYHGQALVALGDTTAATEAYEKAVRRKPPKVDYLSIGTQLGRLYQRSGRAADALQVWHELEASFPNDDAVQHRIARTLLEEGDIQGALERFEKLGQTSKDDSNRIQFGLRAAELRYQLGRSEEATRAIEELLTKARPGSYLHDEGRRLIENSFVRTGNYAGLSDYYERWMATHADDIDAMLRLAKILSVQGRTLESLEWLEKAIQRAPTESGPRLAMIDTLLMQKRFAEAVKQYEKLLEADPKNADYLVRCGQTILLDTTQPEASRQQAAAAMWRRVAVARPMDAAAQSQVADLLRGARMTDQAIASYREAIRLGGDDPQYKEQLGEYLHALNRRDEALVVWLSIAEGNLRTRENIIRLARVLWQNQYAAESLRTMAEACAMKPALHERLTYVEWLSEAKQFEQAIAQLDLAAEEADSSEGRERVFAMSVQVYQMSGQLDQRIDSLQALATAEPTEERWRRLAILYEANLNVPFALDAIDRAVKIAPRSIRTLDTAARLAELASQWQVAIALRRQLADLDLRFRTSHLERLATLYVRAAKIDEALAIGKEMLAGAGGSVEAFLFYADLCGQAGRGEERLETLRRCLRVNPSSEGARRKLAEQLAADFKTDQAIELYWQMLDSADSLQRQREFAIVLAELYSRTNRLDQLLSRLDLRGRELNDQRTAIELTAAVHQHMGDWGAARNVLEQLLDDNARDPLLLERLVSLSEQSGDLERAIEVQRQLILLLPSPTADMRLTTQLLAIGAVDEAVEHGLRSTTRLADPQHTAKLFERLMALSETEIAIELAGKLLAENPRDWQTQLMLMQILAVDKRIAEAAKCARSLLELDVPDTEVVAGAKPLPADATDAARVIARTDATSQLGKMIFFQRLAQTNHSFVQPIDFGNAKQMAKLILQKEVFDSDDPSQIEAERVAFAELARKGNAVGASAPDVLAWFEAHGIRVHFLERELIDVSDPNKWSVYWKLMEVDATQVDQIPNYLQARMSYSASRRSQVKPLSEERLALLKSKAEAEDPLVASGVYVDWKVLYANELRLAGNAEQSKNYVEEHLRAGKFDPLQFINYDQQTWPEGAAKDAHAFSEESLWIAIEQIRAARAAGKSSQSPLNYYARPSVLLGLWSAPKRMASGLATANSAQRYRDRLMQLLDDCIMEQSKQPSAANSIRLSTLWSGRTHELQGADGSRQSISFPPYGLGPDAYAVSSLFQAHRVLQKFSDEAIACIRGKPDVQDVREQITRLMIEAIWLQWSDRSQSAEDALRKGIGLATVQFPQHANELRLLLADLLINQKRESDALAVIDDIAVLDQNMLVIREYTAAKLAAAMENSSRLQLAGKRLLESRLGGGSQVELISLMQSLGMHDVATQLSKRISIRAINEPSQLLTLMNLLVARGDESQAVEIALELLRRCNAAQHRTPLNTNQRSYTQQRTLEYRQAAIQTLASAGQLSSLIESVEKRLERNPKSQSVRNELLELYKSAGQSDKANALMMSTVLNPRATIGELSDLADELAESGRINEACDAFKLLLDRSPTRLFDEFNLVKRVFADANRLDEFSALLVKIGVEKFSVQNLAVTCDELSRKQKVDAARKLCFALVTAADRSTTGAFNLQYFVMDKQSILADVEVARRVCQYFMQQSLKDIHSWTPLFVAQSWAPDGRCDSHLSAFVKILKSNPEAAAVVEAELRVALDKFPRWRSGNLWLAFLLVSDQRFAESLAALESVFSDVAAPSPTYDVLQITTSMIDEFEPMHDFAVRLFEQNQSNPTQLNIQFQNSIELRYCRFLLDRKSVTAADKERVREVAINWADRALKNFPSSTERGDQDGQQVIRLNSLIELMDLLDAAGFPSDAVRESRRVPAGFFAQWGREHAGVVRAFETRRSNALTRVLQRSATEALNALISESGSEASVDFEMKLGSQPFRNPVVTSVWTNILDSAIKDPSQAEAIGALKAKLSVLAKDRPADDSAQAAFAFLACSSGDRAPLRQLVENWLKSTSTAVHNGRLRRQLMLLGLMELNRGAVTEDDRALFDLALAADRRDVPIEYQFMLRAELGRGALDRGDRTSAESLWTSILELDVEQQAPSFVGIRSLGQSQLLELAVAAVQADFIELSLSAAHASASKNSPTAPDVGENVANSIGGGLNSLIRRPANHSSNANQYRLRDVVNSPILQAIDKLHDGWRTRGVDPKRAFKALFEFCKFGGTVDPLWNSIQIDDNKLRITGAFDSAISRAIDANETNWLLKQISSDSPSDRLLSLVVLLKSGRNEEAAALLESFKPETLSAVPHETAMYALLRAFDNAQCAPRAVEFAVHWSESLPPVYNDPDLLKAQTAFTSQMMSAAVQNNVSSELQVAAIDQYLKRSQSANPGSSGRYGLSQQAKDFEELAKIMLMKGDNAAALRYLGMRQSAFNAGLDSSNDWVGIWALENLQSQSDRTATYQMLADWTFAGDGALNSIAAFARRARLPDWIEEDIAGTYPTFPPVHDPQLPIATSHYFLAKLAAETNQTQDLKQRYTAARIKKRGGATQGLAIALAAWGREIDATQLADIEQHLSNLKPADAMVATCAAPLAELQLASLLANSREREGWAKATTELVASHGHLANRSYFMPWLARFQYRQGWKQNQMQSANQLPHWIAATNASAHDHYEGDTDAIWVTDGKTQLDHICGFGNSQLWLRYPLQGNFEFEVELLDGQSGVVNVVYNGIKFGVHSRAYLVEVAANDDQDRLIVNTTQVRKDDWNKHVLTFEDRHVSYSINGKTLYRELRTPAAACIGLQAYGAHQAIARNPKISGSPSIASSVPLLQTGDLRNWTGKYYDQSMPTVSLSQSAVDPTNTVRVVRQGEPASNPQLSWYLANGELTSGSSERLGPGSQSVVQLLRPLVAQESLSYEFYYDAGKSEVHPAVGRTAYMLRPEGIKLHWMTEPYTSWKTPNDLEVAAPGIDRATLPLKDKDWNLVKLSFQADSFTIILNGEEVLKQPCAYDKGEVFGLFHYAQATTARIRNVELQGAWPQSLPENLLTPQ